MNRKNNLLQKLFGMFVLGFFVSTPLIYAADLTSTHFIVRDPVVGTGGGYGTSASFASFISGDMTAIGRGTSASFEGREGFLWYPYATQGAFTATPNGSQADLAWGATQAGLGWSVSGYKTGIATVSGGPYTYTSVGNVTSYSYTDLVPGLYCFVLQTLDAFSNVIATSPEQCITIQPTLTFSNDDATIGFGALSSSSVKYADGTGTGSGVDTTAHTFSISTNAGNGYTLTYKGPKLTSGANSINAASSIATGGTAGTSQFALSGVLSGTGTMETAYNHTNWSSVDSATTQIAHSTGAVAGDSIAMHYEANITPTTPAGVYTTTLTYIVTGSF